LGTDVNERSAELLAEREMDRLDRRLMRGEIHQGEYDAAVHAIDLRVKRRISSTRRERPVERWYTN
jgi:hypothetical protein